MDVDVLTRIRLFRGVEPAELQRVFSELKISETRFDKGDILAMQDEPANRLIILTRGSVAGEMSDPSGRVVRVEDVEAPNPLAILFLFGEKNRFPVQATAREDGTAIVIPKQSVLRMLSMNETLLKNYLDISADFAGRLSRKLHFMSFRTIRQKLAVYLLELSQKQGRDIVELDMTKAALAGYFGVSRTSLEREITRMEEDGLIAPRRNVVTISDKHRMVSITQL